MTHGHNKTHQLQEIYDSLLNHLFLPCYLPSSAESDFCLRSNHRNEYIILEHMNEFLNSLESSDASIVWPIIRILIDCTQRWSTLQRVHNLSVLNLQSIIENLPSNSYLPMYFYAQNAAILIEINENTIDQPYISSWQVLLSTDAIASSRQTQLSCFPVPVYRLSNRSHLSSIVHCELLMDLMKNTIEIS